MSWENILKNKNATNFVLEEVIFGESLAELNVENIRNLVETAKKNNMSFEEMKQHVMKEWDDSNWYKILARNDDFMEQLESNGFALVDIDWEEVNIKDKEMFFGLLQNAMRDD